MKYEEYLSKGILLEKEYQTKKTYLMKEFVDANNPYKIGDKVTYHIGSILIERCSYDWGFYGSPPTSVYEGIELKKDGTPTKKGTKRRVWLTNIKS